MKTWTEIKELLAEDLDVKEIRYREADYGSKQVPYLPGDYVTRKLNKIFGVEGWTERDANVNYQLYARDEEDRNGNKRKMHIACALAKTTLDVYGITDDKEHHLYSRIGEGVCSNKSSRPESAIETAVKGAATDALKRAAMKLGDPFGLCLYNEEYRNSLDIPESKPRDNVTQFRREEPPQAEAPTERRTHCKKCGKTLVRRTGTSEYGAWALWKCPDGKKGDDHTVIFEDKK
jgi:recombination DNA repair RAD52 pathway protein